MTLELVFMGVLALVSLAATAGFAFAALQEYNR